MKLACETVKLAKIYYLPQFFSSLIKNRYYATKGNFKFLMEARNCKDFWRYLCVSGILKLAGNRR